MTYDELLEGLNLPWVDVVVGNTRAEKYRLALRAVVKLHQPVEFFRDFTLCGSCGSPNEYPCQTIQAIEKELK